jgi:DnaJ domain
MTPSTDPYRVLGLSRGASLDEVKRAYRSLAKINHPDAAGPSALPRFLAIQAAYEELVHGTGATRRRPGARPSPPPPPPPPSRPSAADPDRADATYRAYGGRARRTRPAGSSGARGSAGSSKARSSGPAGTASDAGPATDGPKRERGKATLGSTSYDGADAGPFEPDWGGASWYGTTSGTYWTINPKEYADPRKHGPEYQARARRAAQARAGSTATETDPEPVIEDAEASTAADPTTSAGPAPATESWWGPSDRRADAAADADPGARDEAPSRARPAEPVPPPPDIAAAATDLGRALTDERSAHGRWRVVQAIVGWVPLAFGIAWLIGELSGCGRFAAGCDGSVGILSPVLALVSLAILLLVPRLAAIAAAGAIALVVAAVPTALFLTSTGTAFAPDARGTALGAVLLVAWVAGIGVAIARRVRTGPPVRPPDAPVS